MTGCKIHIKITHFLKLFTLLSLAIPLNADVKSTTGRIDFKVNEEADPKMSLTSTGLGLGVQTPSANLELSGNAIISDQLSIGSPTGSSNLNLSGSLGLSYQTLSSNTTLDNTSLILVDTSSANVKVTLPYAGNVSGRIYQIKKIASNNSVFICAENSHIDGSMPLVLPESTNLGSAKIISDGSNWHVISSYQAEAIIASDNLVGYWPLNESSGSTAYDLSENGNHGSIIGLAAGNLGVAGKVGTAMSFDGVDDEINVPHASELNLNGDWSISFWYKRLSHTNTFPGAFRKGSSGTANGYLMWNTSAGRVYHKRNGDQSFDQLNVFVLDTWVHVTYTYDDSSDTISIYVDGQFNDSDTIDYSTNNGTDIFMLGRGDQHGNAILDDFRIYNKVLSLSEIFALYDID